MQSKPFLRAAISFACISSLLFSFATSASAYSVSELAAVYRNGQVFLTWKCPGTANLKYNVYRSTTKFTSSNQLTSSTFLGYVMDSSSKNIRETRLKGQNIYFTIEKGATPLTSSTGLYVVTCTANQSFYYAVTVTNLVNNKEVKDLLSGKNYLASPVSETVAQPQPVVQDTVVWSTGETVYEYAQFGNNQETALYPAMVNAGSYGFNFNLIKRGQPGNNGPLYVFFEGLKATAIAGSGIEPFDDVTNCYIMSLDDWLPDPSPAYISDEGSGTFWSGYHENFNIYSDYNPVPTSGIVRMYAQKRFAETIEWAHRTVPVDTSRTYLIGLSAGGFGALLTANIIPQKIAAVYAVVEPIRLKAIQPGLQQQEWGSQSTNLCTDIMNPQTGSPILIWDLLDIKRMMSINLYQSYPLVFSIHGKNDVTTGWSDKPKFYDSADATRHGGVYYWDRREHNRDKADFLDSETMPDLSQYSTKKSYPAFSKCSINQSAGNGKPTNGAPYGAINGYLTWDNDNITDEHCKYNVTVAIKDFYVGGVLDAQQYTTCTANITFRRMQDFKPPLGATIIWNNYNNAGNSIQNGSFVYTGGLVTLNDIQINKSGNKIELKIQNCNKDDASDQFPPSSNTVYSIFQTAYGYQLIVEMDHMETTTLKVYDRMGRLIEKRSITLYEGSNTIDLPLNNSGLFIAQLKGATVSLSEKLIH